MRTTLAIDDHLLASAKRRARERGLTLGQVVEDALRRELGRAQTVAERPGIPVFTQGTGPRPGVDVSSNRAVLEAFDEATPLERLR